MLVDFSTELLGIDGEVLRDESDKVVTLSKACTQALLAFMPDEKIDGAQRAQRFELATRIHASNGNGPLELDSEEIVAIKDVVGKTMATIIVGQSYRLLEGKVQAGGP